MIINREVSKPIYLQVADYLRNGIYAEEWGKGKKYRLKIKLWQI